MAAPSPYLATTELSAEDAGAQDGIGVFSYVAGPGVWTDGATFGLLSNFVSLSLNNASRLGFRAPMTGLRRSSAGLLIEPPTLASATLNLTTDPGSGLNTSSTGRIYLRVLVRVALSTVPYATVAAIPGALGELDCVDTRLDPGESYGLLGAQQDGSFGVDITVPTITIPLATPVLNRVLSKASWDGTFGLCVRLRDEGPSSAEVFALHLFLAEHATQPAPSLTLTHVPFHTGFQGVHQGRSVHCMRSGLPGPTQYDLIEDGFSQGIWVRQGWHDPDDEFERDTYRPKPNEGGRTDKIPT